MKEAIKKFTGVTLALGAGAVAGGILLPEETVAEIADATNVGITNENLVKYGAISVGTDIAVLAGMKIWERRSGGRVDQKQVSKNESIFKKTGGVIFSAGKAVFRPVGDAAKQVISPAPGANKAVFGF